MFNSLDDVTTHHIYIGVKLTVEFSAFSKFNQFRKRLFFVRFNCQKKNQIKQLRN